MARPRIGICTALEHARWSYWDTEAYQGGTLINKAGVGIYVDAKPDVAARVIEIVTPTKGWAGAIYVAPNGPVPDSLDGFQRLANFEATKTRNRIDLDTATNRYRYYLVWITKLPPGEERVAISEIRLFR